MIRVKVDTDERVRAESNNRQYETVGGHCNDPKLVHENQDFGDSLDVEDLLVHIHHENLVQRTRFDNLDALQTLLQLVKLKVKNGW